MSQTCFVIMPIGDQKIGTKKIKKEDLKSKYNDLIKEAILKANPNLEVIRADEVTTMGSISTDILIRIMNSDYVIADITHPNPNVFYELGLRHASRNKTILLIEEKKSNIPFDISHLRCIEYTNSVTGLKKLSERLKEVFKNYEENPGLIDNNFLDLARVVSFQYPVFSNIVEKNKNEFLSDLMIDLMQYDDFIDFMVKLMQSGKTNDQIGIEIIKYITSKGANKELMSKIFQFGLMSKT